MNLSFEICNLEIFIKNIERKQSPLRLFPFCTQKKHPLINYVFNYVDTIIPDPDEKIIYTDYKYLAVTYKHLDNSDYFSLYHFDGSASPYGKVSILENNNISITLLNESKAEELHEYFILDLLHLEIPILTFNGFNLHSSFIEYSGKAILFTAPSGGGKSTQAELWKNVNNARIINGDKNFVVKKNEGSWMAYSAPVSGSSEYCLNESFPIAAIVILKKGPENILKCYGSLGYNDILKGTVMHPWDESYTAKMLELIDQACNEIPVFQYTCRKDMSAALFLKERLFGKEK